LQPRLGDFSLKVEPGFALPLTHPQSQIFKTGGSETIKALWVVNDYLDVGPSATFLALPTDSPGGQPGMAGAAGDGALVFDSNEVSVPGNGCPL
jgi:hypothetical protein